MWGGRKRSLEIVEARENIPLTLLSSSLSRGSLPYPCEDSLQLVC